MHFNQSTHETTFFINENNQFVLNILKDVLNIPAEYNYTMEYDGPDSAFYMIYDGDHKAYTSFSVTYNQDMKEFAFSMGCAIHPFEGYDFEQYQYNCNVILNSSLDYLRTEVTFHASENDNDNMLTFIDDGNGIYVGYLTPAIEFEDYLLTSTNFMTDSFNHEVFFLTDLYVNHNSIFKTYTIAELFGARPDTSLINNMKQISDMATI